MGYAIAGYRTRRLRHRKERNATPLFLANEGDHEIRAKSFKREKRVKRSHIRNLQDFPIEIIQRIFVLSSNTESMPVLNRYFHYALRPSFLLLFGIMWEKYSFSPAQENIMSSGIPVSQSLITDDIFNSSLFFQFLMTNYKVIMKNVTGFMPVNLYQEFTSNGNPALILQWMKEAHTTEYPEIFYRRMDIYFNNQDFVLYLKKFFILHRPYFIIDSLITWFLHAEVEITLEQFFQAVRFILEISGSQANQILSPVPLITLIENLYDEKTFSQIECRKHNFTERFSRADIVRLFVENFHSEEDSTAQLSDPALWEALRQISDVRIIDLIVNHGGDPLYNILF